MPSLYVTASNKSYIFDSEKSVFPRRINARELCRATFGAALSGPGLAAKYLRARTCSLRLLAFPDEVTPRLLQRLWLVGLVGGTPIES